MKIARRLKITKVDLCRRGANQDAEIMIYKSADHPSENDDHKENRKVKKFKKSDKVARPEDLAKATPEEIKKYIDHLEQTVGDKDEELEKMAQELECAADPDEPDEDDQPPAAGKKKMPFKKAAKPTAIDEEVKKRLDDADEAIKKADARAKAAEERVAKAEAKAELVEIKKMVEADMPKVPGTVDEIAKMLQEAKATLTTDSYSVLEKALKAGSAAIAKAGEEVGSSAGTPVGGSAIEEINKRADELVKKGDFKTRPEAIQKVAQDDPALYQKYKTEKSASSRR